MCSDATTEVIEQSEFDAQGKKVERREESGESSRNENFFLVSQHRLDDDAGRLVRLGDRDQPVESGRRLQREPGVHGERVNLKIIRFLIN